MPTKTSLVAEPSAVHAACPAPAPLLHFNMHDAKSNLSKLVDQAAAGQEIIIAKAGKPAARLVALEQPGCGIRVGMAAGKFEIPADFDDPLPDEIWGEALSGT